MQSVLSRARAAGLVLTAVATLALTGPAPAGAHDGHDPTPGAAGTGEPTDAEHAEQDLADVPMSVIERDAKARADQVERSSGVRPGRRSPAAQQWADAVAAGASRGTVGAWSSVYGTPVVPVFTAMLPNGKVLMWDSVGDGPAETYDDHSSTRAAVWDPATNTGRRIDVQGYNIFCAGYTQLSDGTVLVAGGNRDRALDGIRQTHLFDWRTETWRRGPDMAAERWYPSVAALPNAEALILGGGPTTAEVYQTDQWVRLLTGFSTPGSRLYPLLTVRPDGDVDLVGPAPSIHTLRTSGAGAIVSTTPRDAINRDYSSFATFQPGKTLVSGGGIVTEGGQQRVPTRTAVIVDSTQPGPPTTAPTGSMATARRQHNLTILADGTVLATGGQSAAPGDTGVSLTNAVFDAELFSPASGTWRTLAGANRVRQYHSTAILLPDGRVMTGGGGICGECQRVGYLERNVEYYEPPYLFTKDGSKRTRGQYARRPVITSVAGSSGYNTTLSVTSPQAATIAKVGWVRLGSPTHGDDQGQRYIPATFTRNDTVLSVRTPATVQAAPPGYYMLFIVDTAGVPSVAKFVKLTAPAVAAPEPVRLTLSRPGGRCVDLDHGSTAEGAKIQTWDCNGTVPQRWTRPDGVTLRVAERCMGVLGGLTVPGADVRAFTCNGTDQAQRWTIGTDGTVRSTKNPAVCLTAAGNQAEQIRLQTCTAAPSQIWRY